jgi:hypothetical protein
MRMSELTRSGGVRYSWVEPTSVRSDGKYRVTADGEIRLVYQMGARERALLTTNRHASLVEMVGDVKRAHGDQPSGVFYINEWRHVLVKAGGETWFAGRHETPLEFDLDGGVISAAAPSSLKPGDSWPGPRVGIKYTLSAAGDDIHCKRMVRAQVERKEHLSDFLDDCSSVVREWSRFKPRGGGVYINEARELFAPDSDNAAEFTYLGRATIDRWFPEPRTD